MEYQDCERFGIVHAGGSGNSWGRIDIDGEWPVSMYCQSERELTVLHSFPTVSVSSGWPLRLSRFESEHEELAFVETGGQRRVFAVGESVSTRVKLTSAGVWCVVLIGVLSVFAVLCSVQAFGRRGGRGGVADGLVGER